MSTEQITKLLAEFDDLASNSENPDVQFIIRAIRLHAEVLDTRLAALEEQAEMKNLCASTY
ncbi:hypothetical protein [Caballeronia grimmiae]|uniref:hypothetical protein n=1 Tax=Caballeronia grimmiae TaxID=1071679 RepID=UPI0038BBAB38